MKEHSVTVSIVSRSGDEVNQEITCTEYASTAAELAHKHTQIANAVVSGLSGTFGKMAQKFIDEQSNTR
jgi:hypothetical protein